MLLRCFCLLVLLLCPLARALAQVETKDDERLLKAVSFPPQQLPLGVFLREVTKQSGVDVSMDETEMLSGQTVYVSLPKATLVQVMEAVQSFFSHKNAVSQWQRSPKPPYTYRFVLSKQYNKTKLDRAFFVERIDELRKELLRNADITPEEKEKLKERPALYWQLHDSNTKLAIPFILNQFGEDGFRQILRGEIQPVISVAQLEGEQRRLAEALYQNNLQLHPGKQLPVEKQTLIFQVEFDPKTDCSPMLTLLSPTSEGFKTGVSYITGTSLEAEAREHLRNHWLCQSDTKADPNREDKSLAHLRDQMDKLRTEGQYLPLEKTLEILTKELNLPLFAILPKETDTFLAPKTVKSYLLKNILMDLFTYRPPMLAKWRNGVLLLCPPQWFTGAMSDATAPLSTVDAFIALQNKHPEKIVPFPRLIPLIQDLTPDALTNTPRHAQSTEITVFEVAAQWHPFVRWLARHPEAVERLNRNQEIAVSSVLRQVLDEIGQAKHPLADSTTFPADPKRAEYLRLTEEWQPLSYRGILLPPEVPPDRLRLRVLRLILENRDRRPLQIYESYYFALTEKAWADRNKSAPTVP